MTLTSTARGEPSCHKLGTGAGTAAQHNSTGLSEDQENLCRDTNEQIAGEHESRAFWEQIAGAPHPTDTPIEASPTPVTVDLFAVRQRNAREAFAGGAACAEGTPPEELDTCERTPVIYATNDEAPWHEDYTSDDPGYVGAIAWIGKGRALAVGGDGTYPRREPNPPNDSREFDDRAKFDETEGAGDARAWYFHDGDWEEISDQLPEEMGGLTALDIWIGREDDGDEWGLAGDYGHIWEWEGGRFTGSHIDNDSPGIGAPDPEWGVVDGPLGWTRTDEENAVTGETTTRWDANAAAGSSDPALFQYRVRDIRIAPDRNFKRAFAFTSGCCGPASAGGSRMIEFNPRPKKNQVGVPPPDAPPPNQRPRWLVRDDESGTADYGESVYSFALKPNRAITLSGSEVDAFGERNPAHQSMIWSVDTTRGLVTSSAAPEGEGASQESPTASADEIVSPPQPRYVASDGDTEVTCPGDNDCHYQSVIGNGIPDWKVGTAPPGEPELRGLGLLATTVADYRPEYGGIQPRCNPPNPPDYARRGVGSVAWLAGEEGWIAYFGWSTPNPEQDVWICRPEQIQAGTRPAIDPDGPIRTRETGIQAGPSWTLNGIDMLDAENIGYAVGDRGAIMRFGSPPVESAPPSLGARRPERLQERSPYEDAAPDPAAIAGEVPSLASQPREAFGDPQLVRAGSPNGSEIDPEQPVEGVQSIVMSRDGSEGWALGYTPGIESRIDTGENTTKSVMTLYHYTEGQWRRCDPVGAKGMEPADEACASLAEVYKRESLDGRCTPACTISFQAAARIPLEYDDKPTNDDEFELLAVGSAIDRDGSDVVPAVLRYADGEWSLDDFESRRSLVRSGSPMEANSLACTAPDECWITMSDSSSAYLQRFDGTRWIRCSSPTTQDAAPADREGCGDLAGRLDVVDIKNPVFAKISVTSAGDRVYLAGSRQRQAVSTGGVADGGASAAAPPIILYKDYGKDSDGANHQWQTDYDPGGSDPSAVPGIVRSISVAKRADGRYEGWAVGAFEMPALVGAQMLSKWPLMRLDPETGEWDIWRVKDASYDYLGTPLKGLQGYYGVPPQRLTAIPGSRSQFSRAYVAYQSTSSGGGHPPSHLLAFSPERARWELAEQPGMGMNGTYGVESSRAAALTPDSRGGLWAAFETGDTSSSGESETYFYNYTTAPPKQVFTETAHPLTDSERLTDLAGARDGTVWVTTHRGSLYRRDRLSGWERVTVPGWDPGRVVTRATPFAAVALAPDGTGLAVGEAGRIAELGTDSVRLDEAAGTVCDPAAPVAPCSTSFDLRAAAVTPEGAALVGGEKLALLAREDEGTGFVRVASPDARPSATVTAISMPTPTTAWLALDSGQIFSGTGGGTSWRWRLENTVDIDGVDRLLTEDRRGEPLPVRDIAVDESGHGFAVGDGGIVLERTPGLAEPWRRVESGVTEKLTSVTLPAGAGPGALIGGDRGLVLTYTAGDWKLVRSGDQLRADDGYVAGVALLPGYSEGEAEAWVGVAPQPDDARQATSQLLHYSSDPSDPLLAAAPAEPLPDVPAPREGEISFAALGRSDCQWAGSDGRITCPPLENGIEPEQTILRRIRNEVLARSQTPGGPDFSIFTGDAYETGGATTGEATEQNSRVATNAANNFVHTVLGTPRWTGGERYRRFNEQLIDWMPDRGLPTFASIGARDLSETRQCASILVVPVSEGYQCAENRDRARVGENLTWRQAMEAQPAPWGAGDPIANDELAFEPLGDDGLAVRSEDQEGDDPTDELPTIEASPDLPYADLPDNPVPSVELGAVNDAVPDDLEENDLPDEPVPADPLAVYRDFVNDTLPNEEGGYEAGADIQSREQIDDRPIPTGGANTHYAAEIIRGEEPVARLIVVDTSLNSLAASDAIQQPLELDGGQRAWLERVLCIEGSTFDTGQCTRERTQQAIVVSNSPTYSYGPTNPTENLADATLFESILLKHRANVVVSGKLGWNGRYWATAPGVHEPCPGEEYIPDDKAPAAGTRVCGQGPAGVPDGGQAANQAQTTAAGALADAGGAGVLPFVVASGAGGRFDEFAERAGATAPEGIWRGYTIVRLHPSGDPRETIVEQRPVFDWVRINGREHVLRARQSLRLEGAGREPIGGQFGSDSPLGSGRFDEIESPAITHRYDLVLADAEEPWKPCTDSDPACLKLQAGLAKEEAVTDNHCAPYLCLPDRVGQIDPQVGTVRAGNGGYPDTFAIAMLSVGEHVATYPLVFKKSPSFVVKARSLTPPLPAPTRVPSPQPPPPIDPPPTPTMPKIDIPVPPPPPGIPPLTAATPPELQPPSPPAPPPPAQQPTPLDLSVAPPGVSISTPTALIQPPTPPVNPAPPGGARKEARQRQAAAQKGGADAETEAGDNRGDQAPGPPGTGGAAMTRRDASFSRLERGRPEPSFTAYRPSSDGLGAGTGLLYASGMALLAFALATGWRHGRPTPRRRHPELPAPAWSADRRRRH